MLIQHLKVSGLLSFGPTGIDLPLGGLNVLIGPNGSGKSNLLEVLALLRAAPTNLPQPIKEMGGVREWLWKGPDAPKEAVIEADVWARGLLRHTLRVTEQGERFEVADESIESPLLAAGATERAYFYRFRRGQPVLYDRPGDRPLLRDSVKPEQSILSQVRDPERYPELAALHGQYSRICLFRDWSFGPKAPLRREQSAHGRGDFLSEGGENLALVLSEIGLPERSNFLEALRELYSGIVDFRLAIRGGNVHLYLVESDGREIPATRLSDGTLRYLCLLAILLHPEPPPLIAIEEPELGLHPDVIPHVAELLVKASERTQLVVTTHSRLLVDALSDHPETVIVCEKENGESRFERLDAKTLASWLEKYSLGQLWSMGELGGNRW
ncbi:MAG TPA: AAA family ATPase [Thermoanaerobaculia bacterium]|nr:AAA family ATPase [Thermoanaerobaculia bacterium]